MKMSFGALAAALLAASSAAAVADASELPAIVDLSQPFDPPAQPLEASPGGRAVKAAAEAHPEIRTAVVLEHGKIVAEYVRPGVDANVPFQIWSCTKSWISFLVGMLVDQGMLDPSMTLGDLWPADDPVWENSDDDATIRQSITLYELLTMSSGLFTALIDPELNTTTAEDFYATTGPGGTAGGNSLAQALTMDTIQEPRNEFRYLGVNNIFSYLIQNQTGLSPREFLAERALGELGILDSEINWWKNEDGMEYSYHGLELTAHQMAKFGQLYLQGGVTGLTRQAPLISNSWINATSSPHVNATFIEPTTNLSVSTEYGYLWWLWGEKSTGFGDLNVGNFYCAVGAGGQDICVHPELDRVVVQQKEYLNMTQDNLYMSVVSFNADLSFQPPDAANNTVADNNGDHANNKMPMAIDLSQPWNTTDIPSLESTSGGRALKETISYFPGIRTALVLEHGKIVAEYVRDDVDVTEPYPIWSCTKSWMSLLMGCAADEGLIDDVTTQTLGDFWPADSSVWTSGMPVNDTADRAEITLQEMLTMSSGLTPPPVDPEFMANPDWSIVMDGGSAGGANLPQALTMDALNPAAGEFHYLGTNNMLSYLIQNVTKKSPREYLNERVLQHIGIDDSEIEWWKNEDGMEYSFHGLALTAHQMAKFGQLYLQNGLAAPQGPQVISQDWITASLTKHVEAKVEVPEMDISIKADYGYLFWLYNGANIPGVSESTGDFYCAVGLGGQDICVSPSTGRVAVQQKNWDDGNVDNLVVAATVFSTDLVFDDEDDDDADSSTNNGEGTTGTATDGDDPTVGSGDPTSAASSSSWWMGIGSGAAVFLLSYSALLF